MELSTLGVLKDGIEAGPEGFESEFRGVGFDFVDSGVRLGIGSGAVMPICLDLGSLISKG
jgi:hypothetical protein